jgi:hypothetical protein
MLGRLTNLFTKIGLLPVLLLALILLLVVPGGALKVALATGAGETLKEPQDRQAIPDNRKPDTRQLCRHTRRENRIGRRRDPGRLADH